MQLSDFQKNKLKIEMLTKAKDFVDDNADDDDVEKEDGDEQCQEKE